MTASSRFLGCAPLKKLNAYLLSVTHSRDVWCSVVYASTDLCCYSSGCPRLHTTPAVSRHARPDARPNARPDARPNARSNARPNAQSCSWPCCIHAAARPSRAWPSVSPALSCPAHGPAAASSSATTSSTSSSTSSSSCCKRSSPCL